jgi:hypothetical protein
VLLHLRGLARDDLLARLHDRAESPSRSELEDPDVDIAADAALRATALLAELEASDI